VKKSPINFFLIPEKELNTSFPHFLTTLTLPCAAFSLFEEEGNNRNGKPHSYSTFELWWRPKTNYPWQSLGQKPLKEKAPSLACQGQESRLFHHAADGVVVYALGE